MQFSKRNKGRELPIIIQILTIFGVVEQRQLRLLFSHLTDAAYGKIISVLKREGLAYFSADGSYISTSRYSMTHKNLQDSITTFWVFVHLRDRISDFCASDPPAILTFSASDKEYDLLPGSPENIPAINLQADSISEDTIRLIAATDMEAIRDVESREKNDYLALVDEGGVRLFRL